MKLVALILLVIFSVPFLLGFGLEYVPLIPTITALVFSLVLFLVVANYDAIEVRYKHAVLKTFKRKVDKITQEALAELEGAVGLLENDLNEHIKQTKIDIENAMIDAVDTAVDEASNLPARWG